MTNREPSYIETQSESDLLTLIPGDMVKTWLDSKSNFMVYGLDVLEKLTEESYFRLIQVPEPNIANVNNYGIWKVQLRLHSFSDGIRLNSLHLNYGIIDINSAEFEKAKGLVELLNKPKS